MMKKQRLDNVQKLVFGYIWLNGSLTCTRQDLSEKLNIKSSLLSRVLTELDDKRWIRKARSGKGIKIETIKRDIPNYILEATDKNFKDFY